MSATRSTNLQPQQRLDISSIKLIESASNYDLDLLAGISLAGKMPVVFKGLIINTANTILTNPSTLTLKVADSVLWHYLASESGTVFQISQTEPDQLLSTTNPNVSGSFVTGANYVGLELYKTPDTTTSDIVAFYDKDTNEEFTQTIPLARTIKYKIVISTQPFSVATNVLPIAKIQVSSNIIVSITDARNMMFRLGSGGDNPSGLYSYNWGSRTENPVTFDNNTQGSPFIGADKNISSLKDWVNSVMSSVWEIRGGKRWYSPQHRDHVKAAYGQPILNNGDNFWFLNGETIVGDLVRTSNVVTLTFTNHPFTVGSTFELNSTDTVNFPSGTKTVASVPDADTITYSETGADNAGSASSSTIINTVAWTGMKLLFENSFEASLWKNDIVSGSIVVPDKYCLYVDLDRDSNNPINISVKPYYNLGVSNIPGRRMILGWREGIEVYTRDRPYEAGRNFLAATTSALGLVRINNTAGNPSSPVVPVIMSHGGIEVVATVPAGGTAAGKFTGANSSTSGVTSTSGIISQGGTSSVGNSSGGHGIAAVAGNGIGTAVDGTNLFISRNNYGLVSYATGSGAGASLAGTLARSTEAQGVLSSLFNPWATKMQGAGSIHLGNGTNRPSIYAFADTVTEPEYTGRFGAFIKGGSSEREPALVIPTNGLSPSVALVNNKYLTSPTIPKARGNLWISNDEDTTTSVDIISDAGHTGVSLNLTRASEANGNLIKITNNDGTGIGANALVHIENTNLASQAYAMRITGAGVGGISNGIYLEQSAKITLADVNNKINYLVPPTYIAVAAIQDSISSPNFWQQIIPIEGDPFSNGSISSIGGTAAGTETSSWKVSLPKKCTITAISIRGIQSSGSAVDLRVCAFKMNNTPTVSTLTYINTGGTAGDVVSLPNAAESLVTVPISSSNLADGEILYVKVGRDSSANGIVINSIRVTYTLNEISGVST